MVALQRFAKLPFVEMRHFFGKAWGCQIGAQSSQHLALRPHPSPSLGPARLSYRSYGASTFHVLANAKLSLLKRLQFSSTLDEGNKAILLLGDRMLVFYALGALHAAESV